MKETSFYLNSSGDYTSHIVTLLRDLGRRELEAETQRGGNRKHLEVQNKLNPRELKVGRLLWGK